MIPCLGITALPYYHHLSGVNGGIYVEVVQFKEFVESNPVS